MFSDGAKWSSRRKIITPTFHFDILNDFLVIMNENIDTCVEKLKVYAQTDKEFDMFKHIGLCTLDIICGKHLINFY